ncbi:radical SAM protein [Palaeococcus ferrophilus]|uniref:radical SAM protein n=1 Tax=Palaeococcus ferrophilus TaxID=83868 RepID=UPI00064FADD3|nr:radical SAM protein [Palaeococcus ferrophilus]
MKIRISYGTAIQMGLKRGRMLARPFTAYLMTYHDGRCRNNCAFCPQARESNADVKRLSRVTWPAFELEDVLDGLKRGNFARICLQTIDYPGMVEDVKELLKAFQPLNLPTSVSITPVPRETLVELKELGVDYIGVGLDASAERIYPIIKDSLYGWDDMWAFTRDVLEVFGPGSAFVHIIIGLGETDREALETIQRVYDMGGSVSLFAFTPIKGTRLESLSPPPLERYRRIQAAHYLIRNGLARVDELEFDGEELVGFNDLKEKVDPVAFMTHGCPGCNRPYYNEKPGKEPYNFPARPEKGEELLKKFL